jgi:hypothetical protein
MHYKKYEVRSRLFALRDPQLAEQVLAAFAGAARRNVPTPKQTVPAKKTG